MHRWNVAQLVRLPNKTQRSWVQPPTLHRAIVSMTQANLSRPLFEEEVVDALAGICRTSCPGSDFFEKFWDVIKVDLVDGLEEARDVGCLLAQFQEGMIFLIPTVQGVITDARQWRPITLLNTIYKIFANTGQEGKTLPA